MDDLELLREYARHKSEEAFAILVKRHVDLVYSTSLRLVHDPHVAEEITQAVFLLLARKAARISSRTIVSGWLYRTAAFTAGHALRARARRRRHEQEAIEFMKLQVNPQETWERIAPVLDEALSKLAESDRNLIVLRFFERKPFREVGNALGISEDAAKKRTTRALEKLRATFAKQGLFSPAGAIIAALSTCSVNAAPVKLTAAIVAGTAAKGPSTAAALAMAKQTMKLMAWSNGKTALVSGLAVVLLGTAMLVRRERSDLLRQLAVQSSVTAVPTAQRQPPPPEETPPLNWREIESDDDAVYMANLRKHGFPEEVVRAIITDRIIRAYAPQLERGPYKFWAPNSVGDPMNIAKTVSRTKAIKEREQALARLGLPVPYADPIAAELASQRRIHAYLGPEKLEAYLDIESKYSLLEASNGFRSKDLYPDEDEKERRSWKAEKRAEIVALMTPEELEQYDLRTSHLAARLRYNLDLFQTTEEDFVKIFRVLSKAEPELNGSLTSLASADVSAGRRPDQAKQRLDDELKAELGEERFVEYSKKRDSSYRGLENLAQRFGLPGETVEALYLIHNEAVQARAHYRYDASIPEPQRQPGWLTAQAGFVEQVRDYLDEKAFNTYQHSRLGSWLEGPYDKY